MSIEHVPLPELLQVQHVCELIGPEQERPTRIILMKTHGTSLGI
jgi:hypothetical protein